MEKIELFEKAIREKATSLKDWGINPTLFWAYRNSIRSGNNQIDFSEVIWDHDINNIAKFLKENNIQEFTISSSFSNLVLTLAEFAKHGFQITGLTEVRSSLKDFDIQKFQYGN